MISYVNLLSVFFAVNNLISLTCPDFEVVMIMASWNVCGISNPLKCRRIKKPLSELPLDWFGIQESKLHSVDSSCIAQLTGW